MKTVLVSGCFEVLHGGHVQFLKEARELGDRLVVCIPSDRIIRAFKGREPAVPVEHRKAVVGSLRFVDEVAVGDEDPAELNFAALQKGLRPDILAVTSDDRYEEQKKALCKETGTRYHKLPKTKPKMTPTSTTEARRRAALPSVVPIRVDFAGGWLDVPRLARKDGYVVNCAVMPGVSLDDWPYRPKAGLGGSAARSMLLGEDPLAAELNIAGWQDPAVIQQTGLCVWLPGQRPRLALQVDPSFLDGRMALVWTGSEHDTASLLEHPRDYDAIARASRVAASAARSGDLKGIADAIHMTYLAQLGEGMKELPEAGMARKYCGSGHGGYAVYLFPSGADRDLWVGATNEARSIEPYTRWS